MSAGGFGEKQDNRGRGFPFNMAMSVLKMNPSLLIWVYAFDDGALSYENHPTV